MAGPTTHTKTGYMRIDNNAPEEMVLTSEHEAVNRGFYDRYISRNITSRNIARKIIPQENKDLLSDDSAELTASKVKQRRVRVPSNARRSTT